MKSKKKLEVEACLDTILKKSKHFEKVQTGNKLNICYNCILTRSFSDGELLFLRKYFDAHNSYFRCLTKGILII